MSPRKPPQRQAAASAPPPGDGSISQIKSRRRLLWIASLVFAIWLAMLLVMYFSTVYPRRHPATSPAPTLMLVPDPSSR